LDLYFSRILPSMLFFDEACINDKYSCYDLGFNPALFQYRLDIIGQMRMQTFHTKTFECNAPRGMNVCYKMLDVEESDILKEDLYPGTTYGVYMSSDEMIGKPEMEGEFGIWFN
jgi:hypothetical protein